MNLPAYCIEVPLDQAYRLHNHGPTVLVSAAYQGERDVMAAAWNMPLDFAPPKLTVVLDKSSYTRALIEKSGTFVLQVPTVSQKALVNTVGSTSGRDIKDQQQVDKLSAQHISSFTTSMTDTPLIEGCVAWMVCRLIPEPHNQQAYDLFIGEVIAAYADSRVFKNGRWDFSQHPMLRTLHHVAGGFYFTISDEQV